MKGALALGAVSAVPMRAAGQAAVTDDDRAYWIEVVKRVSEPVLEAVSKGQLRARMPVEAQPGLVEQRRMSTHLEAFGRLISGLGPWLESAEVSGPEAELQARYREWARAGIRYGTDPASADYMKFGVTSQSVVDTAFLV
ncbi:MAG TPA: DUF2264 domain-containing protein, partial [Edaphobacter sp.]|nr:DUF2264 domain-containing protein [Edaphobacter sp.]